MTPPGTKPNGWWGVDSIRAMCPRGEPVDCCGCGGGTTAGTVFRLAILPSRGVHGTRDDDALAAICL